MNSPLITSLSPADSPQHTPLEALVAGYSANRSHLAYLWGPAGSGKSYFLRHFLDHLHTHGSKVFMSSVRDLGLTDGNWAEHIAQMLDQPRDLSWDVALVARAQAEPFCWIIDDFDHLRGSSRETVLRTVVEQLRYGCGIVLAGRSAPAQLLPGASYLQDRLITITLRDWNSHQADTFLKNRGVSEEGTRALAVSLSQGRPRLLAAIADGITALNLTEEPTMPVVSDPSAVDLVGFLIEQICHPGSRRLIWRAGQPADPLDTLIAAAALTPIFNRDWLTRVVGRSLVDSMWDTFATLPFLTPYRGGYYGLFPTLRRHVANTVRKVRPWTWERWSREAVQYTLRRIQAGGVAKKDAWWVIAPFIRPRLGFTPFDCWDPGLSVAWATEAQTQMLRITNAQGTVVGEAHCQEMAEGSLHVVEIRHDATTPSSLFWVLTAIAQQFYRYQHIRWTTDPDDERISEILSWLKFRPTQSGTWTLSFVETPYQAWLSLLARPPIIPLPEDPVKLVQSVLQAFRDGHEHFGPTIEAFWQESSDSGSFRTWFLDALTSVEGDQVDGKTVLVLYYLDRRGTHEELAEVLHVSRATYFRKHRQALERLADAVFH